MNMFFHVVQYCHMDHCIPITLPVTYTVLSVYVGRDRDQGGSSVSL